MINKKAASEATKETGVARYIAAVLSVVAALMVAEAVHSVFGRVPSVLLLYLVPVTLAATRWGFGPSIVSAVFAVVAHNVLFIEPIGSIAIDNPDDALGLALLIFTAAVTAKLANDAQRATEKSQEAEVQRRSNELKTALLHAVSHELRTPLASIKASVSSLRQPDAALEKEDSAELLAAIEEETDRLNRTVSNLLDASRLEADAIMPNLHAHDLAELLETVAARLRPVLGARSLTNTVPADLPLVRCDYALVDQVVANLLENIAKHTPPSTSVSISARASGDAVTVEIADDGPGIPAGVRDRVFRPFEQGAPSSQGTGLGLTIARGLLEAQGGRIWLAENVAKGTRFLFTIPLAETS